MKQRLLFNVIVCGLSAMSFDKHAKCSEFFLRDRKSCFWQNVFRLLIFSSICCFNFHRFWQIFSLNSVSNSRLIGLELSRNSKFKGGYFAERGEVNLSRFCADVFYGWPFNPLPPLFVRTHKKFRKILFFFSPKSVHVRIWRTPPCPHWTKLPMTADFFCGRLLMTKILFSWRLVILLRVEILLRVDLVLGCSGEDNSWPPKVSWKLFSQSTIISPRAAEAFSTASDPRTSTSKVM